MSNVKKKTLALILAAALSLSGAAACGALQDEVQQQAEDEVDQQRTNVEQRLDQEKTKALEKARTTVEQGN